MAAEILTVICAWCQRIVTAAPPGSCVTHTICQSCLDRTARMSEPDNGLAIFETPSDYFGDAFKP
jgi:hypothetical protein